MKCRAGSEGYNLLTPGHRRVIPGMGRGAQEEVYQEIRQMVYFMQAVDGGPIKIGFSSNVSKRRKQLEGHFRRRLVLLATMKGDYEEEQAIHKKFAHLRIKSTEQFQPARELMEFIGRPLFAGPDGSTVAEYDTDNALISLVCCPAFKAWVVSMAEEDRKSVPDLIDKALFDYAKECGFEIPPKRL